MAKQVAMIAKCKGCNEVMSTIITTEKSVIGRSITNWGAMFRDEKGESGVYGNHAIRCRKCGKGRAARPVKGTYNPEHICSAKCLTSKGFACDCSCGGKNHGGAYAA
jgi:hypothetical protein